jgi:hypothetical protein
MKFKLEIECGNAAFGEYWEDTAAEIARILIDAATEIDAKLEGEPHGYKQPLRDANGNKVGFYEIED